MLLLIMIIMSLVKVLLLIMIIMSLVKVLLLIMIIMSLVKVQVKHNSVHLLTSWGKLSNSQRPLGHRRNTIPVGSIDPWLAQILESNLIHQSVNSVTMSIDPSILCFSFTHYAMLQCSWILPIMFKKKNCGWSIMIFIYNFAWTIHYMKHTIFI